MIVTLGLMGAIVLIVTAALIVWVMTDSYRQPVTYNQFRATVDTHNIPRRTATAEQ